MKKLMIAILLGGQAMAAAQPVLAADFADTGQQRPGAFAGLRLRVPLDGNGEARRIRAGLAVAPSLHSRTADGGTRLRIGEGLELGITGREPVRLRLAGQDVRRLGAAQQNGEEEHEGGGPSTVGWIAIGVGAAVVTVAGLWALCFGGTICNFDED